MKLWNTQVVGLSTAQLTVNNGSELKHILRLVKGDLLGDVILVMTDPAISELIPLDLQLSESIVEMTNDLLGLFGCACHLDIIHMLREHGD